MFIRAVILLSDGSEKIITADGKLAPLTFTIKYFFTVISKKLRRGKGKYQLIKLVCDNPIWLQKFRRELPHVKVSFGFKEGDEVCVLE